MFLEMFLLTMILPIDSLYQSNIKFTSFGLEYQPNNNFQLITTNIVQSKMRCSAACNQLSSCRIFDYDTVSKRCRLFEGDLTTGSIMSSSSTTSLVGIIQLSSSLYSSINSNQTCQACQQNRYSTCSVNTSRCQCPVHTYWNGSICALQRFENETCEQTNACRSDLNLTCMVECYGQPTRCLSPAIYNMTFPITMNLGLTMVGGVCNDNASTNQIILANQGDVVLANNNTLYTGDNGNRLLVFDFNNRTGRLLRNVSYTPSFFFFDNRTSNIYFSVLSAHLVYIWPSNQTIPPNGLVATNCSYNVVPYPTGIVVDSVGNAYISSYGCHWITKWLPNATNGTVVAGSPTGASGSDSLSLNIPYGLALDEPNSHLYVVDRFNHRIQRFVLGSNVGVTVAGGSGQGSAINQLYRPTDIHLSRLDGSLYIVDCFNNRIQKWAKNATSGITVAGNPNGALGMTPYLLNKPYGITLDYAENYLYVSDSVNNRIQRFSLA